MFSHVSHYIADFLQLVIGHSFPDLVFFFPESFFHLSYDANVTNSIIISPRI
jgi:hypothetical protein